MGFLTNTKGKRLETTIKLALVVGSDELVTIISVSTIFMALTILLLRFTKVYLLIVFFKFHFFALKIHYPLIECFTPFSQTHAHFRRSIFVKLSHGLLYLSIDYANCLLSRRSSAFPQADESVTTTETVLNKIASRQTTYSAKTRPRCKQTKNAVRSGLLSFSFGCI